MTNPPHWKNRPGFSATDYFNMGVDQARSGDRTVWQARNEEGPVYQREYVNDLPQEPPDYYVVDRMFWTCPKCGNGAPITPQRTTVAITCAACGNLSALIFCRQKEYE